MPLIRPRPRSRLGVLQAFLYDGTTPPDSVRERVDKRLASGIILLGQVHEHLLEQLSIPASEKLYLVFDPHTRWIGRGKVRCQQELGTPVVTPDDWHELVLECRAL